MSNASKVTQSLGEKLRAGLAHKPMWVSWLVYMALSGTVLGVSYGLARILLLRWWVAGAAIVAAGLVWGTISRQTPVEHSRIRTDSVQTPG